MNTNVNNSQEIDVRVLIPIKRHELLLKMFKDLPLNESFTFINDHDPLPLYYEFQSIHGDVVGWEYLNKGGRDWKVKVTRTENSIGREFKEISTLMDLRKVDKKDWKHVVFHRYGMMREGDAMEIIAEEIPNEIQTIFNSKFGDKYSWEIKKQNENEVVIHIMKIQDAYTEEADITLVKSFDVRPFPPAERHDMVFNSFDDLAPGQAFVFINDHDPKPLYYQIEAESGVPFKWEYLIEGPEEWKVKVTKSLE